MADRVYIFDTTLRDGEQSPGCSMTVPEKLRMAAKLVELGVDILEAGFPIASEGDSEAVDAVSREFPWAHVAALARASRPDIEAAIHALRNAKRQSGFSRYVLKASRRRHFEGITAFPHGLLPFGDTICRFNPVYGQGMSVAAQEACLLQGQLAEASKQGKGINSLASTFLAETQKLIETPWSSSAIPDFLDPLTEGPRPPDLEDMLKFGAALSKVAAEDPAVHKVMVEVQQLLKPGSAYQAPEIAERIKAAMASA